MQSKNYEYYLIQSLNGYILNRPVFAARNKVKVAVQHFSQVRGTDENAVNPCG